MRILSGETRQVQRIAKPTSSSVAVAMRNKIFNVKKASCKVSPSSLTLTSLLEEQQPQLESRPQLEQQQPCSPESIVLHDPLMRNCGKGIDGNHSSNSSNSSSSVKKSNLLHTIKIYLHGSRTSLNNNNNECASSSLFPITAIDADCCCNSTPAAAELCGDTKRPVSVSDQLLSSANRSTIIQSDHSERKNLFSLGSTSNSIIRDSVNTSLSIFCSAPGGCGQSIVEVAAVELADKKDKETKPMTSPTATTFESLQDPTDDNDDPNVDLDSEFREVLQFNIGQSVRAPPRLRGSLRHVTSIESDNNGEEEEEEDRVQTEPQWVGTTTSTGGDDASNLCVSEVVGDKTATRPTRRSRRLIPFHNLQDNKNNCATDTNKPSIGDDEDEEEENVRSYLTSNEFQSMESFYSGFQPTATEEQILSGGGDNMPAHGDLLCIDVGGDEELMVLRRVHVHVLA